MSDYNQAVRLEPSYADRYRDRGDAYSNHKDYEKAIADFNEAIRLKPKQGASTYYGGRGWAYFNQQDNVHAIADFDEAINLDATIALNRFRRGLVYKALKNDQRLDDFSEAVKLEPNNFDYLANRAQANFDLKKYEEATADYTEMIRRQPKKAIYYVYRGNALAAKREFVRASTITRKPSNSIRKQPALTRTAAIPIARCGSGIWLRPITKNAWKSARLIRINRGNRGWPIR